MGLGTRLCLTVLPFKALCQLHHRKFKLHAGLCFYLHGHKQGSQVTNYNEMAQTNKAGLSATVDSNNFELP